jgi:hypothetical protein
MAIIRDATNNDFGQISKLASENELLSTGIPREEYEASLKWLYASANVGNRFEIVVESDSKILAHCGVMPIPYVVCRRYVLGGFVGNLVIDKKSLDKTLFFKIQNELTRGYQKAGFDFLYALVTRKEILNIQLRMGWRKIRSFPVYVRPIALFSIAKKYTQNPFFRMLFLPFLLTTQIILSLLDIRPSYGIVIEKVHGFDNSFLDFINSWSNQKIIFASRRLENLNWRFLDFKARGYTIYIASKNDCITGYVVLRLMSMKGYRTVAIVDLIVGGEDARTRSALIKHTVKFAKKNGVDLVATLGNPFPGNKLLALRYGFINTREEFSLLIYAASNFFNDSNLICSENWHISWFDHDFV